MENSKKISMLEDMLELPSGSLTEDMLLSTISEYDSMAKLSLIVLFDDEFGKKLTGEQIRSFVTVGDILRAMEN